MGFEDFEPIFGEAKAEWLIPGSIPLHPFLFYVYAPDPSCLKVNVSDFRFNTWEAVRSVHQLEDMRDSIGIGGSWSEFIDYVVASVKSEDVKFVLEGGSDSEGAAYAKLVAQKSKGMPRITISLAKLVDTAASEANANLSLDLFKAFKSMQNLCMKEQEQSCQLAKVVSAEQEKNENIQSQLEFYSKRQKLQKMNVSDKADASAHGNGLQNSPGKVAAQDKVTNRVVPAYRRARVRGVLLQDTEDDKDN